MLSIFSSILHRNKWYRGLTLVYPPKYPKLHMDTDTNSNVLAFKGRKDVFVDIGASMGCVSLCAAVTGFKKVFAYEPNPASFSCLKTNIRQNGYEKIVYAFPYGITSSSLSSMELCQGGEHAGQVGFYYKNKDNKSTFNTKTKRFVDVLKDAGAIDFLKVDIEAGEFDIFRRSEEVRNALNNVGAIDIELHAPTNHEYFDETLKFETYNNEDACHELIQFLINCGFVVSKKKITGQNEEGKYFLIRE